MRNIVLEKPFTKSGGDTIPRINSLKVLYSLFLLYAQLKAIKIYWNYTADHLLLPHIKLFEKKKKKQKRGLELVSVSLFCVISEEKYFSCYVQITDQISLSGWLYFVRYWALCVL